MSMTTTAAPNLTPRAIRQQRRAKGLSQAQLAAAAGLSHPSIVSNIERGLRPGAEVEAKIADVLR